MYDFIVIGGGAAGVFAAIQAKIAYPEAKVALLEKSAVLLSKVRVSGGGRCNVTHSCFDPKELVKHYPRGEKELIGPFHRFQPQNTIAWFEERGVKLKTESDGRMFPTTDSSETIIHCLTSEMQKLGVEVHFRQRIEAITFENGQFCLKRKETEALYTHNLLLATGSSAEGYGWAEKLGHTTQKPVPSLFTFNVPTSPLKELSGISLEDVQLELKGCSMMQRGPLLLTHFGFSGPAALKLSAWAARFLHEKEYRVPLIINWLPTWKQHEIYEKLVDLKNDIPHKTLVVENPFRMPKSLWRALVGNEKRLDATSLKELMLLSEKLHADVYQVQGKTTNKEEFVTCGGVTLKEVSFKTMESKLCPGLFFAGEILDIDGVTGGFNFQNAWTTGYIAGNSIKVQATPPQVAEAALY